MDVVAAFLNGSLDKPVYMKPPPGMRIPKKKVPIVVRAQRPGMLRAVPKPLDIVKEQILGDMLHDKPLEPHSHLRSNLNDVRAFGKPLLLQNRIYKADVLTFVYKKWFKPPGEDGEWLSLGLIA
jgi:hypothetical protein